jgi:hypothetical protein
VRCSSANGDENSLAQVSVTANWLICGLHLITGESMECYGYITWSLNATWNKSKCWKWFLPPHVLTTYFPKDPSYLFTNRLLVEPKNMGNLIASYTKVHEPETFQPHPILPQDSY